MSFEAEVWEKLSAIDVKPMMEKTQAGVGYVSWSKLWTLLMKHYPRSHYVFEDKRYTVVGDDGPVENVEVFCKLTIVANDDELITATGNAPRKLTREMWLPVMQSYGQFKCIDNPTPRDISDTRMRCLVKCAAMFGLGISAWAGDDCQPDKTLERILAFAKKKSDYRMDLWRTAIVIKEAFQNDEPSVAAEAWMERNEDEKIDLWLAETKGGFFTQAEKEWLRAATLEAMQPTGQTA